MSKRHYELGVSVQAKKARMQQGSNVRTVGSTENNEIDEDLHSRQLAVYGKESMRRMASSRILVCGALGVGLEAGVPAFLLLSDRVYTVLCKLTLGFVQPKISYCLAFVRSRYTIKRMSKCLISLLSSTSQKLTLTRIGLRRVEENSKS